MIKLDNLAIFTDQQLDGGSPKNCYERRQTVSDKDQNVFILDCMFSGKKYMPLHGYLIPETFQQIDFCIQVLVDKVKPLRYSKYKMCYSEKDFKQVDNYLKDLFLYFKKQFGYGLKTIYGSKGFVLFELTDNYNDNTSLVTHYWVYDGEGSSKPYTIKTDLSYFIEKY